MYELSLFILDLAQNSLTANASLVTIRLLESAALNRVFVAVADNGCGMSPEIAERATDPFMTTKAPRQKKIGLGLPFFKQLVEMCGGSFRLVSRPGRGTIVRGTYPFTNVDQPPVGDLDESIFALVAGNPDVDFRYTRRTDSWQQVFDTRPVKEALGPDARALWQSVEILDWLRETIRAREPRDQN